MLNRAFVMIGVAMVLLVALVVVWKTGVVSSGATEDWTTRQLADQLSAGTKLRLIDVREPVEYTGVHIDGAILIPLGQLAQRLDELERNEVIAVICQSGRRSAQAVEILRQTGFKKVHNVLGGMSAWNGPIITGN